MRSAPLLAVGIALALLSRFVDSNVAGAAIPGLEWGPVEIVDGSVEWLPPASGTVLAFADGRWHIVYTIGGYVTHRAHGESGWLGPEYLSLPGGTAFDGPAIAAGAGFVHVVWESASDFEIYTRRWDGSQWSAAECLSCNGWPSWGPVIAGAGSRALVAWEENGAQHSVIRGRIFESGAWGPVDDLSTSPADARRPSVSDSGNDGGFFLGWVDLRDGDQEIYVRHWTPWSPEGWQPEERATDLEQAVDFPSIHGEDCCGDVIMPSWGVAFEYSASPPLTEAYWAGRWSPGTPLSTPGRHSFSPVLAGYHLMSREGFGGPFPHLLSTWTDGSGESFVNLLDCQGCPGFNWVHTRDTLSTAGAGPSTVAAVEGPVTRVMAAWIEDRAGVPTLVTRAGTLPGESADVPEPPHANVIDLLVAPNPVTDAAELRLILPTEGPIAVRILDVTGREVRDLGRASLAAGPNTVRWDGLDGSGRRARPGLYFAVVRAPGGEARRAFVLLR